MTRYNLKSIVALLFILLLATACTGKSTSPNDTSTPSAAESPKKETPEVAKPSIDKPTKVTIYHQWGLTTEGFMDLWGKYVVKKYPNVTFEVINEKTGKLDDLVASNTNIDIIVHVENHLESMKRLGLDTDLTDLIKKYNYDLGLWDPSVSEYLLQFNGGKIPAIPITLQTLAFFYNKDLFSKFGVPFPTDNMTWDDVIELSSRMTREEGGVLYWGYDTVNNGNKTAFNQLSLPMIDPVTDKPVFDSDSWKKYLDILAKVARVPGFTPFEGSALFDGFIKEERIAMTSTNSSNISMFGQNPALNWDVASYPSLKELPGVGMQAEFAMWYIASNSKNREAAFLAAMEVTSHEVQKERSMDGDISVLKHEEMRQVFGSRLAELDGKNAKAIIPKQLAKKTPYSKYVNEVWSPLNKAFSQVLKGEKDMNTALRDAIEDANRRIEEKKQKE